ncbi:Hypothetical protein NTJ_13193 [Nesidiocoris tenuis]|uniref:Uncharacterized protein n=1 Tax=Nesidiocoris tenuis TaxID=355587 RepID=A0ABN7B7N2_9HEMI|nr:Hypothetical protein NTJ_13193 [Nesidiocoris tenuis]
MRAAEAAANAPRPPTPEPMRTPPPAPPMEGMLEAEMRRQHDLMQTVTKQRYDSLMPRMSDIMVRTGRTCPIRIYRGEPVEHHPGQVTMLEYDQSLPVSCLFGSPEPPPVATCQSPPPVCSGSPDDPEVPIRRFGRVPHIAQPPSPPVSHLQGPERYALTYDTERIRRTAGGAGEHFDQVPEMPLLDEFDPQDDQEYWSRAVDDWMNQPFRERRQRMEEERARMTCRTPPEVHPVMSRKQLRRRLEGYRPPQMELPDDPRLPPVHRQRVVPYHEVQPARSPTPPPRTPSPPRPVHVPCDELVDLRTPPRGPQSPETPERQSPWTPLFTPRKEGPTQEEILERRKEVMGRVEKACQPGKQFPSRMGDIEEARWRCERANVELPRRPLTPESPGPGLWDPCDQMFMERQLQRQLEAMSSGSEPSPRQPSPRQPSPRRPSPRQPSCPEPASDFALPRFQLGPQARHLLDEMGCLPLEDYGC